MNRLLNKISTSRSSDQKDAGVTLAEMVVGLSLFGILTAIMLTIVTQVTQTSRSAQSAAQDTNTARVAMEGIVTQLRSAADPDDVGDLTLFERAAPNEVIFYSKRGAYSTDPTADNLPHKVRIWLAVDAATSKAGCDVGDLCEEQYTSMTDTVPFDIRRLATGVTITPTTRVFKYLKQTDPDDSNGRAVSTIPLLSNGTVDPANFADIKSVEVELTVQKQPGISKSSNKIVNRIALTNVGIPTASNPADPVFPDAMNNYTPPAGHVGNNQPCCGS